MYILFDSIFLILSKASTNNFYTMLIQYSDEEFN
jgi:hypothetical protein